MEWLTNLSNAIAYIEENLDKEISYEEAARIACCSTCYFQRIFTYVAGISLAEYIRRRRMSQAAFELQRTDKKVLEVAYEYGYSSPTSFNRAFQSVHGITPAAAKRIGSVLNAYPPVRFSVEVTGGQALSYRIEKKEALRIAGIRTPLVENMEENLKNVPSFWNRLLQSANFGRICNLSTAVPKEILGISVYQSPENMFYYIAASLNSPAPSDMYEYEIPAATWVIFENDGLYKESVQGIFQRFYKEWLLFSGYEYAGLPDIEVYPVSAERTLNGHSQVWIAIKKVKER